VSLTPLPTLDQLASDPGKATALPLDVAEKLLAQVHVIEGALLARLLAARSQGNGEALAGDRLLNVEEAARKLGMSEDWCYRQAKRLPFVVRNGRQLRFSERGIERYIRQRQGR